MVTPPKGDYASVPLNPEGRKAADAWDLRRQRRRASAAPLVPPADAHADAGRISWQDDNTLKVETDAGQQMRLFEFETSAPSGTVTRTAGLLPAERTWQGVSAAQWFRQRSRAGWGSAVGPAAGRQPRAVTRHMRAGYLRKNGVPDSEDAIVTEAFHRHDEPNGDVGSR